MYGLLVVYGFPWALVLPKVALRVAQLNSFLLPG